METINRLIVGVMLVVVMETLYKSNDPCPIVYGIFLIGNFIDLFSFFGREWHLNFWAFLSLVIFSITGHASVSSLCCSNRDTLHQLMIVVALSDVVQYVVGRLLGRMKIGSISPKKTYEGYIGGLLLPFVLYRYLPPPLTFRWIISGIVGGLLVSLIKRSLKIKDISEFLGPHGGWLDRMDGIYMASILEVIINNSI